jgi:hypothetical protein
VIALVAACLVVPGSRLLSSCGSCDLEVLSVLFPHLAGLQVERVFLAGRSVRIQATTALRLLPAPAAAGCPGGSIATMSGGWLIPRWPGGR